MPTATEDAQPPVRLVALDIDGTLIDAQGLLSPRTVEAAGAAREAGIRLVIATGRRHDFALPIARQLGLAEDDLLISSTGTVHRTMGGALQERTLLGRGPALALVEALEHHRDTLVFTFDDFALDTRRMVPHLSLLVEDYAAVARIIPRWVDFNAPFIAEVRPIERGLDGREPIQAMVLGNVAEMRAAELYLRSHPAGRRLNMQRTEYLDRDLAFVDLLPPGCGKGASLARVAERLGIAREETAAIGDNNNDLDMLRWAGRAFVVANASGEVMREAAERGWRRIASNEESGPAEVLQELAAEHALACTNL